MVKSLPEWHFSCTMFIYNSDIFLSLLLAVYVESLKLFIATWYLDTCREKKKQKTNTCFKQVPATVHHMKKQRCWKHHLSVGVKALQLSSSTKGLQY